jgi:cysteinyl-tRNA synthetase
LKKQIAGSRVEVDPEKRNPWDFMLWVTNQPEHIMKWDSPWGVGFPGWHIECTAMSTQYLGDKFDIHTGGKEHIPVHHTNEIAQGFGAFGASTANYWIHNAHLRLYGKKMSKSLGNVITVQDVIKKGIDPLALRYLFLNSHYRKGMNFGWEALESASNAHQTQNSNLKIKTTQTKN